MKSLLINNPKNTHIFTHEDIPAASRTTIRALKGLSNRYGLISLSSVATMYLAAGFGFIYEFNLLASILMCFAMMRGAFLMHDACHGTLTRNRLINYIGGVLCGLPIIMSLSNYRIVHLQHHRYVRSEDDPGNLEMTAKKLHVPLGAVYATIFLFGAPLYIVLSIIAVPGKVIKGKRFDILAEYILIALFFTALVYVFGPDKFTQVWLYPFFVTSIAMNIRNFAEHELTGSAESTFTSTRTVTSNRFVRWLMHNENYHLEHHLYPDVPFFELPKIHEILQPVFQAAGSSVSKGYLSFYGDLLRQAAARIKGTDKRNINWRN